MTNDIFKLLFLLLTVWATLGFMFFAGCFQHVKAGKMFLFCVVCGPLAWLAGVSICAGLLFEKLLWEKLLTNNLRLDKLLAKIPRQVKEYFLKI